MRLRNYETYVHNVNYYYRRNSAGSSIAGSGVQEGSSIAGSGVKEGSSIAGSGVQRWFFNHWFWGSPRVAVSPKSICAITL